jgi:flagellin
MSLGVLNNIAAVYAENNLNNTQSGLQTTLEQLSSGSRINSGADDAAGLSLVDGLGANSAALTQSSDNANQGVGLLQVADGALSQVTNLLNRAVTLATEASNGTLTTTQDAAANQEYQSILAEVSNIGSTATFNGNKVFSGAAVNIYSGDATTTGGATDALTISALSSTSVGDAGGTITATGTTISYTAGTGGSENLSTTNLSTAAAAQTALTDINTAITDVAGQRGYLGSQINTLNAISGVDSTEQTNVLSAQNSIQATDYGAATSNLSKFEILEQTGVSALAQANSVQQEVTKLLQ